MGDAWFIGPFLIQEKWALYVVSIKKKALDIRMLDALWNGFFVFLMVWKASYALFHPINVIQHPMSLLYFTGGDKGVMLGVISVLLYFFWKSKRSTFSFSRYMECGLFAILTALGSYRLFVWMFYLMDEWYLLITALLPFVLMFYLLKSEDWLASLLLFSLAEFIFSYVKNGSTLSFALSWEPLFYFVVAIICLLCIAFRSRNSFFSTLKKFVPILLLGGLMLWGGYDFVRSFERSDAVKSKQESDETIGITQGSLAPNFSLISLHGEEMNLSDFRGKHVILNFWASWCPPCRAEMPDMQAYYHNYREDDNVIILAVNLTATERHLDTVRSFANEIGITFPILLDEQSEVANLYEVVAYPTSYFIDEQGTIQSKVVGPMNREYMLKQVKKMNR